MTGGAVTANVTSTGRGRFSYQRHSSTAATTRASALAPIMPLDADWPEPRSQPLRHERARRTRCWRPTAAAATQSVRTPPATRAESARPSHPWKPLVRRPHGAVWPRIVPKKGGTVAERWRRKSAPLAVGAEMGYGSLMNFPVSFPCALRKLRWLFALSLASLAACGGSGPKCVDSDEPYLGARSNAPLRVPDGMTQPNRSEALAIPAAKDGERRPAALPASTRRLRTSVRRAPWRARRRKSWPAGRRPGRIAKRKR